MQDYVKISGQSWERLRNKYGQKIIDIRPTARYNIVNLIRKPSDHCYKLNRNGGQLSELDGTEWLYPPGAPSTGRAPKGALQR